MKHTPCEYIVWNGLPVIRKEIAVSMIDDYGLSQKETAEKLGISPAAVSQYLSGKRGKMNITDKELCKQINKSAERIIQQGDGILVSEICRLCKISASKKLFNLGKIGEKCEIL
jgi:predicted transcriptional regulator